MKKKKKTKKKLDKKVYLLVLISFILGIMISITSSYVLAQTLVNSSDVYYDKTSSGLAVNNVQAAIDGTCTKFSNELNNFLNKIYPVGTIYTSTASTNPSSFLGGTWENYGNGRVLKGINSGTAGATGGSDTVTLTTANLPAHTHTYDKANANTGSHTLTIAEMPSHTHVQNAHNHRVVFDGDFAGLKIGYSWNTTTPAVGAYFSSGVLRKGTGSGTLSVSASTATNQNTGGDGGHTHTISTTSTNTGSTGSSTPTAINVQNSYITVYMWRRTK